MNPKSQCPGPGAQRWWRYASFCAIVALAVLVVLPGASFAGGTDPSRAEWQKRQSEVDGCALLNNPKIAGMMDGLLFYLAKQCNRFDLIGGVKGGGGAESDAVEAADSPVSNPALDGGTGSRTQSETSISRNPTTGTLCAAWNDSFHGVQQGLGFSGFGRSTDNGVTWTDKLNVSTTDSGDPSLIWRKVDGKFYYIALNAGGLAIWRSDDDCNSFVFVSQIVTGNDDKEIATVDNNPASAFYGRIYVAWTDFGAGNRIHVVTSSNAGATWTAQVPISATGEAVQGAWPAVAPSGDVFVAWHHWLSPGFPTGNTEIQVARSTDGGATFNLVTPPVSNVTSARDTTATSSCGRPALKGNVRYLPSPTIAVGPNGHLHAVYSYDPDATGSGDVVNVYYRRSTDNGATWQPEIQVNDDGGTNDQYQPSLSVSEANVVTVGYYSRQNDVNNVMIDYYKRSSFDGGVSFSTPSVRLSDVSSPIVLDSSLATCYHGDYDTQITEAGTNHPLWSDDRGGTPDIYTEGSPAGTDFFVNPTPATASVCAPTAAHFMVAVPQFQGFSEAVTLSASGNPAGSTVSFGTNPVTPPGSSTMDVSTTGVSAGTSVITVTGTSSPSSIVHTGTVSLTVATANPGAPALVSPANNAINVPVSPTFSWNAATQGETYTLEVATDAGFTNIVGTATVAATMATLGSPLNTNTVYFWRVRSTNACGTGSNSSTFTFTVVPAPGDCPIGVTPTVLLTEDFETTAPGWTSSGTGNTWASSTVRFHGGTHSWKSAGAAAVTDQRLDSPSLTLPVAGDAPISLIFWNHQTIEDNPPGCFDGAVLEISTDGGTTFTRLEAQIQVLPYDGIVSSSFANPLAGTNAWCGDPRDWTKFIVDLSSFAGQTVKIRFRHATDNSVSREGWYLDDVVFQSCRQELFSDGFETGNTSAWALTFP